MVGKLPFEGLLRDRVRDESGIRFGYGPRILQVLPSPSSNHGVLMCSLFQIAPATWMISGSSIRCFELHVCLRNARWLCWPQVPGRCVGLFSELQGIQEVAKPYTCSGDHIAPASSIIIATLMTVHGPVISCSDLSRLLK